ncbi:MAG: hypothetical protein HY939_01970 [Gammaproteobacteria bacterium]|nr:hypothetical protein [Gammaproteobacteria bacterium]
MKLDKRQKIILAALALLVAFLVWQLLGLRSHPTPPAKVTLPSAHEQPKSMATASTPALSPAFNTASASMSTTPPAQPQLLPPQQVEYLQTVDQYQLAQIKRLLAEQVAATAAADESTAKSKAETNKILATNINPLDTFIPALTSTSSTNTSSTSQQPAVGSRISPMGYQVVFIGNKEGKWSAILARNNEYTIVTPGMTLGSQVTVNDINADGVSLKIQDTITTIPFQNNLIG